MLPSLISLELPRVHTLPLVIRYSPAAVNHINLVAMSFVDHCPVHNLQLHAYSRLYHTRGVLTNEHLLSVLGFLTIVGLIRSNFVDYRTRILAFIFDNLSVNN